MVVLCVLKGGLGNQLFQVYATIATAMVSGTGFRFCEEMPTSATTPRTTYWDTAFASLRKFTLPPAEFYALASGAERLTDGDDLDQRAWEAVQLQKRSVVLDGYFQQLVCFQRWAPRIASVVRFPLSVLKPAGTPSTLELLMAAEVSMHFRFGDYLAFPHVYHLLDVKYYRNALAAIGVEAGQRVMCFCEAQDTDRAQEIVTQLEAENPGVDFAFTRGRGADWQQLADMTVCRHHVIANSTFSWWGAFMDNQGGKVCYPANWYTDPALASRVPGMFPSTWLPIRDDPHIEQNGKHPSTGSNAAACVSLASSVFSP
jgi:hypothetical protein